MSDPQVDPPQSPPPPPPAPAATWFTGMAPEDVGYIQNKGWHQGDAAAVTASIFKSYREAETKLGAPADRLLRRPTDGDEAATKAFWQQLGAPADPKDYAFTGVDLGTPEETTAFTEMLRTSVSRLNLPKETAAELARDLAKDRVDRSTKSAADLAAKVAEERRLLEVDWGKPDSPTFKANMGIADRTAASLGITQDVMDRLKEGLGGVFVAKMFRGLGDMTGEAKYMLDPNNKTEVLTVEQAQALRYEKTGIDANGQAKGPGDPTWLEKWRAKDGATMKEWNDWLRIISGSQT